MAPPSAVLIVVHDAVDPPGYLGEFLRNKNIDYIVVKAWESEDAELLPHSTTTLVRCTPHPTEPKAWDPVRNDTPGATNLKIAGVVSLGGRISANDNIPYYAALFDLLRDCVATRTPFLGHCLGAQQLCVALGGKVTAAPVFEFDFLEIKPCPPDASKGIKKWFLDEPTSTFFMSHAETFSIPEGCHLIATGETCRNQVFQVGDQYILGTQFHPEVTPDVVNMITTTSKRCPTEEQVQQMTEEERQVHYPPCVKTQEALVATSAERVQFTRKYVDQMYEVWTTGVLEAMKLA